MRNQPPTILIVDDSSTTRAMIKRVIGMTGLAVGQLLEAGDGQAGLAVMESSPVDLVLADLNMPVMEGVEMIRRMRQVEKFRGIPVVVISAQPDERLVSQLKRDGVVAYLAKPFTAEAVRDVIRPILDPHKTEISDKKPEPDIDKLLNLSLAGVLAEALEIMAFISPEFPAPELLPCSADEARLVQINFHNGQRAGSLVLTASRAFGALIAGNCDPLDDSATALEQCDDALKELANITCGLLLRKRLCGSAGFEMGSPTLAPTELIERLCSGDDTVALNADGFLLRAHVTTDRSLPQPEIQRHGK